MDRETLLLLALGLLVVAALTVGVSGWMLFARDRRLAGPARHAPVPRHPEDHEEFLSARSSSTCGSGASVSRPPGSRSTPP